MHMLLNKYPKLLRRQNKSASNSCQYIQFAAFILLSFFLLSDVTARPVPDKYYLRLLHNAPSSDHDFSISSIGMLSLKNNFVGHADLTQLQSDIHGKGFALDFGGGYAFTGDISLYLLLGVSLGYNSDKEDYITTWFPEVGIVLDFTKTFGITVSGKRYFNLYEENEDVVMLGLVFRK